MAAVIHTELDPPRHAGSLTPVIEGLLAKDPAQRMTAETAAGLLKAAAAGVDGRRLDPPSAADVVAGPVPHMTSALPPGPHVTSAALSGPRGRGRAGARVALAGLLCVVLATGGWYGYRRLADATASGSVASPVTPAKVTRVATTPSPPAARPSAVLPAGWTIHKDPLGFSVALPKGWTAFDRQAARVSFHDSSRSGYLLVDFTKWAAADPVPALTAVEAASRKKGLLPGYQRIRLAAIRRRGAPAAEWEFTYTPSYGRVRVLDRAFRLPDGGYAALYWQTTDRTWTTTMSYFGVFLTTFVPNE
jgi:hypothetical protein